VDRLLEDLVFSLLAVGVGLVIGLIVFFVRARRNARNVPTQEKKQELLAMIQDWKALGYSYSARLELLQRQGLRKDVADALLGEAEKMQKAP
jgi:hypothetical protein